MSVTATDSQPVDQQRAAQALACVRQQLLMARVPSGHWEGELSSSALSTATAAFALWLFTQSPVGPDATPGRQICQQLSERGAEWLIAHQNADGGWGDTPDSISNISTTVLCWAALRVIRHSQDTTSAIPRAQAWLARSAGSVEPDPLAHAIIKRYGEDRTFSVPILTMCVLAGQLGPPDEAWKHVIPLPFELAALPQSWFRFAQLPVVSYALPALIAIGQVHHHQRPSRNPAARMIRWLTKARTLRVLKAIQPPAGGFLEATPLTSFVVMSLIGAGQSDHLVTQRGLEFIIRSIRPDGSWPIDTNLATWVTTLSINALADGDNVADHLDARERQGVRDWLLEQQYRVRHPYTGAAPGAWAWTNLAGGVPDADDTAGALLALAHLGEPDARTLDAVCAGVRWLLDLQNRDGGMPTFCRGWGKLPFDRSAAELTAHALEAWRKWRPYLPDRLASEVDGATNRAVRSLAPQQRGEGSWTPLWFGNQAAPDQENPTYGTSRVLLALGPYQGAEGALVSNMAVRAIRWLLRSQNSDGGWGGDVHVSSSIEETSQAIRALCAVRNLSDSPDALAKAVARGVDWLICTTHGGTRLVASPIGLYFAKLWYTERLYPLIGMTAALGCAAKLPALVTVSAPTPA